MQDTEIKTLFKCSFCGLNKRIEFLDSALDEVPSIVNAKEQIELKEQQKSELERQFYAAVTNKKLQAEIQTRINLVDQEIIGLFKSSEIRKKFLCITCRLGSKKKIEPVKFTCEICGDTKSGEGIKMHIDN